MHHPGESELRRRHALAHGQRLQRFDQPQVVCACLALEARHVRTPVVPRQFSRLYIAGQETAPERTVGNEADAQLAQRGQHRVFHIAGPQRILALHGCDRLDGMGAPDQLRRGLGHAEVTHLALGNQIPDRTRHVLDRNLRIDAVLIEQIDTVGTQPRERGIADFADMFGTAVEALDRFAGFRFSSGAKPELGRDRHMLADRCQRRTDHFLTDERTVDLRRIEEGDAALIGAAQQGVAVLLRQLRTIGPAHTHAAKPQSRDFEPLAEFTPVHSKPLPSTSCLASIGSCRLPVHKHRYQ